MSKLYRVDQQSVKLGDRVLGPLSTIYIDSRQHDYGLPGDTKRCQLPVGDVLMVNGRGQLILIEEKKPPDLVNSWFSHRMQRQLRRLAMEADIGVLGLRGGFPDEWIEALALDLVKVQVVGLVLAWLPTYPDHYWDMLRALRATLQPGRHLLSPLAGRDKQAEPPLTGCALALWRLMRGSRFGPRLAREIALLCNNSLITALTCEEKVWMEVRGVGPTILAKRKELNETEK